MIVDGVCEMFVNVCDVLVFFRAFLCVLVSLPQVAYSLREAGFDEAV